MGTAVIWDTSGEDPILFFVVDSDVSHLDGVYVNASYEDENDPWAGWQEEVNNLVYDDAGQQVIEFCGKREFEDAIRAGATVIVCGFLP